MINKLKKIVEDAAAMATTVSSMMGEMPNYAVGQVTLVDKEAKDIKKENSNTEKEV